MKRQRQQLYGQLCAEQRIPLLSTASWFAAASIGKDWDVIFIPSAPRCTDEIKAALPYHMLCRYGVKAVLMPQLTMLTDIYIRPGADTTALLQQLSEAFDQRCRNEHIAYCYLKGNWPTAFRSALEQHGFQLQLRHTHQIQPTNHMDQIVAGFSENKRRQYRHAHNLKRINLSQEQFYAFHRDCLAERGQKITYSEQLLHAIFTPLLAKQHAALWGAENTDGQLLAALGLVWDDTTCYYLLPTYWRPSSKSGAMAWLTTQAILQAGEQGLIFDFEGGNEGGIARSYREFGGISTTYYSAEKYYNPLLKLINTIKRHI